MLIRYILARTWRSHVKSGCVFQSLQRNLHASGVASAQASGGSDTPEDRLANIDVDAIIANYAKVVDESRLSEDELAIHKTHIKALGQRKFVYKDPVTHLEVLTILNHLERGDCCGNACRHCPYEHKNVEKKYKENRRHNTAFYN